MNEAKLLAIASGWPETSAILVNTRDWLGAGREMDALLHINGGNVGRGLLTGGRRYSTVHAHHVVDD
jgi:hypothetical protein